MQRSGLRGGAASDLTGLGFHPGSCYVGSPGGSADKESTHDAGDLGLNPGLGRSPGEGNGKPLSIAAWKIPWTEEPRRLQSMESQEWDTT